MNPLHTAAFSPFVSRKIADLAGRRIAPADTNYFVPLFGPLSDGIEWVCVIEIFAVGGATPPNMHRRAHELFYVLAGQGLAKSGDIALPIARGDALMLRPGTEHVIENSGADKLYTLTFMIPNEGFAELIAKGQPVALDAADLAVLRGIGA